MRHMKFSPTQRSARSTISSVMRPLTRTPVSAAVAAVENGYCDKDTDITVKLRGGELVIRYTDETVYLTGSAETVYEGIIEI